MQTVRAILAVFARQAVLTAIFTRFAIFRNFQQSHAKQLFIGRRVCETVTHTSRQRRLSVAATSGT